MKGKIRLTEELGTIILNELVNKLNLSVYQEKYSITR